MVDRSKIDLTEWLDHDEKSKMSIFDEKEGKTFNHKKEDVWDDMDDDNENKNKQFKKNRMIDMWDDD